nr:hypothetical protein [Tanacetum cinerariifolium]
MQKQNTTIFKKSPETMEAEFQTEIASSEVVSPVAPTHHIIHKNSSEGVVTNHTQFKSKLQKYETMEAEFQTEIASSEVVSPVAPTHHIIHKNSSEGVVTNHTQFKFASSNDIIRRQVEEAAVKVDSSCTLGRFLNMEQFGKFIEIGVVIVTQMYGSNEKDKNLSLYLLGAIFAVYVMELWVMPSCKVEWKIIVFRIASNSTKLLSLYLLICILKPEWLSWCRFVVVYIIATGCTCSDELNVTSQNASAVYQDIKTKFTWCFKKCVLVISYMIEKVLTSRKDQASPASAPPRASV